MRELTKMSRSTSLKTQSPAAPRRGMRTHSSANSTRGRQWARRRLKEKVQHHGVEEVRMRPREPVRRPFDEFEATAGDDCVDPRTAVCETGDTILIAVDDECRNSYLCQVRAQMRVP